MAVSECESRLRRALARWRLAAVAAIAAGAGAVFAGAAQPATVVGVCGGDRIIYRVWSDGNVDRLLASGDTASSRGVPTWGRIKIDANLKQSDTIIDR